MGYSSVVTWLPPATPGGALTQPHWLGQLGPVTGLKYGYKVSGGPDQLTCTLLREPDYRTDAMDPGRVVQVFRGGQCIWDGKMLEPVPTEAGWNLTATGLGNAPADYSAIYTTWTNQNDAINQAIARGLRLSNPGISASVWLGQQQDSGALQCDALLDLFCTMGSFYWYITVNATGGYGVLHVQGFPAGADGQTSKLVPTHLATVTIPVARTLGNTINTLYVRYQSSANNASAPAYAVTSSKLAAQAAKYGPVEAYEDISSAQHLTAAQAQALATAVLNQYVYVSYSGPFTLQQGELMTPGGQAIDMGMGLPLNMVIQAMISDFASGGDVAPGPITFLAGAYEWDDDAEQATITPYQALDTSFTNLLSAMLTLHTPPTAALHPKPKPKPHRITVPRKPPPRRHRHHARKFPGTPR